MNPFAAWAAHNRAATLTDLDAARLQLEGLIRWAMRYAPAPQLPELLEQAGNALVCIDRAYFTLSRQAEQERRP